MAREIPEPGICNERSLMVLRTSESLGFILPPAAMRVASEFQEGKPLPGDLAFVVLAVALEQIPADYAEEFLCDLARFPLAQNLPWLAYLHKNAVVLRHHNLPVSAIQFLS